MCSYVGTFKSGCITISSRVSSVSVSVPDRKYVPYVISRSASAMASSISAISYDSSVAPVLPDYNFIPVLSLLLFAPVIHHCVALLCFCLRSPLLFFWCILIDSPYYCNLPHFPPVPHTYCWLYAVCGPPGFVFPVPGFTTPSPLLQYSCQFC